jgi:hypothetical protein
VAPGIVDFVSPGVVELSPAGQAKVHRSLYLVSQLMIRTGESKGGPVSCDAWAKVVRERSPTDKYINLATGATISGGVNPIQYKPGRDASAVVCEPARSGWTFFIVDKDGRDVSNRTFVQAKPTTMCAYDYVDGDILLLVSHAKAPAIGRNRVQLFNLTAASEIQVHVPDKLRQNSINWLFDSDVSAIYVNGTLDGVCSRFALPITRNSCGGPNELFDLDARRRQHSIVGQDVRSKVLAGEIKRAVSEMYNLESKLGLSPKFLGSFTNLGNIWLMHNLDSEPKSSLYKQDPVNPGSVQLVASGLPSTCSNIEWLSERRLVLRVGADMDNVLVVNL